MERFTLDKELENENKHLTTIKLVGEISAQLTKLLDAITLVQTQVDLLNDSRRTLIARIERLESYNAIYKIQ